MAEASHVVAKAQCPECANDSRVEEVSPAWSDSGLKLVYSPYLDYKGFVLPEKPAMPSVPLAHATPDGRALVTLIDQDLFRFDIVWAAAGHPNGVFPISPDDLYRYTGAPVAEVAEAPR